LPSTVPLPALSASSITFWCKMGKHYFVADVHLGLKLHDLHEREKAFAAWLDSITPDVSALYLLGDIFDFWWEYKYVVPKGYVRILGRLAQLADRGVAVHFFKGNHDRWTYGYLEKEVGLQIHNEPLMVQIGNTRFCLGHGDGLGLQGILDKMFCSHFLQRFFSNIHPRWWMSLGYRWSAHNRKTNGVPDNYDSLIRYALAYPHRVDYFIFGHLHTPLDRELPNGARLVVLGEWMPEGYYAVFDESSHDFASPKFF